jgi:putative ABC transport system permease protein
MFGTHLKFFVRVFLKDKFFSLLNILGLAMGIAVSIILLLILQFDLAYDKHYPNHERIFRLGGHLKATGIDVRVARTARELGEIIKEEFPEVVAVTRANSWDHTLVKYQSNGVEVSFYEEDVVRTDSTYFQVFQHQFIAGDPTNCLHDINAVVITASAAEKYFGSEDPLDKTLLIDEESWKVTGVIKDLPENTHMRFNFLLSGLSKSREWVLDEGQVKSEAFWNPDVYTYFLMTEDYDAQRFYDKFPSIYEKYFKSFGDQVGGQYDAILQPLAAIHFDSSLVDDEPTGNMAYLYAFSAIGLFIILLACINYMNLSTAKSVNRASEIAMKKTLGSDKKSLVFSFFGESIFLSLISLVLALLLVFLVLNFSSFNSLIQKNLSMNFFENGTLLLAALGVAVLIGIISGLYPAFYLPGIPTISALKGSYKNQKSSLRLRKVLTATQFSISIFVVVCTFFMKDQISFVRSKDLGFNKENILILPIQDTLVQNQITGIKNEFLQNPKITQVTTAYQVPGMGIGGPVMYAESVEGMIQQQFKMINIGEDYFETMGINLLQGRDFQPGKDADYRNAFICNQAAAKLMGWGDDPVGKKVRWFHGQEDGYIIGMVEDFNFRSLHNEVEPLLMVKPGKEGGFLHLKVSGEDLHRTVDEIKSKWLVYDPNHPFEYFFLDQRFNEQYKADEIQYSLLSILSYICIFISLLGLLGLSAFTAAQRTKEIGIRKVHGASIPRIIYLLYREVMLLVILAGILVIPAAWYIIDVWLGNFAYKTPMNYFTFLVVTVFALVAAFLTVAFHSLKTATTNPIKSLKYE